MSVTIYDDDGSAAQGVSWTTGAMVVNGTMQANGQILDLTGAHVTIGHDPAREYGDGYADDEDELVVDMDEERKLAAHRQRTIERELGEDPQA